MAGPSALGLPSPTPVVQMGAPSGPTAFTPGSGVTVAVSPVMLLAVCSNQGRVTSVTQTGVTWTKVGEATILSGADAVVSLWLGTAQSGASTSLVINQDATNSQAFVLWPVAGLRSLVPPAIIVAPTNITNAASATLIGQHGSCAIVVYFTRGGTPAGPWESGWHRLIDGVSAAAGTLTIAWRQGADVIAATITGATDHAAMLLMGFV